MIQPHTRRERILVRMVVDLAKQLCPDIPTMIINVAYTQAEEEEPPLGLSGKVHVDYHVKEGAQRDDL